MTTDITWVGQLKKQARPEMSIDRARAILSLLYKKVLETPTGDRYLPKTAYEEVADSLKIGKMTVRQLWGEVRKALHEYTDLEDYWKNGRPYQYRKPQKVKAASGE